MFFTGRLLVREVIEVAAAVKELHFHDSEIILFLHEPWNRIRLADGDVLYVENVALRESTSHSYDCTLMQGVCVLDPDNIIAGTRIITALNCMRSSFLDNYFRDFRTFKINSQLRKSCVVGRAVHEITQFMVLNRSTSLPEAVNRILATPEMVREILFSPFDFLSLAQVIFTKHGAGIGSLVKKLSTEPRVSVEISVASRYGIGGNIDFFIDRGEESYPIELKTNNHTLNHQLQALVYVAALDSQHGDVFYTQLNREESFMLREVDKRAMIMCRNEILSQSFANLAPRLASDKFCLCEKIEPLLGDEMTATDSIKAFVCEFLRAWMRVFIQEVTPLKTLYVRVYLDECAGQHIIDLPAACLADLEVNDILQLNGQLRKILAIDQAFGRVAIEAIPEGNYFLRVKYNFLKCSMSSLLYASQSTKFLNIIARAQTEAVPFPKALIQTADIPQIDPPLQFIHRHLNQGQRGAITESLFPFNRLVMIEGLPGTGKTQVLVEIVEQMALMKKRVLIITASNNALDTLLARLSVPFLRLGHVNSVSDEKVSHSVESERLRRIVANQLTTAKYNMCRDMYMNMFVIGATAHTIQSHPMFMGGESKFTLGIIDEAGMMMLPNALFPIDLCQRIIFVGDWRQLSPIVNYDAEIGATGLKLSELGYSVFETVRNSLFPDSGDQYNQLHITARTAARYLRLVRQYRMSKRVVNFVNECLYDNVLEGDNGEVGSVLLFRDWMAGQPIPLPEDYARVHVLSPFKRSAEAFYAQLMANHSQVTATWSSVDAFQGKESETIIYYVPTSGNWHRGTIDNLQRLTVALTRARRHLIMFFPISQMLEMEKISTVVKKIVKYFQ